ncbi:MAG: AbrB/MazE/SpoVT family DNA-binding domain-containing protein [Thermoleophilia bacterium]
MPIVRLGRRGQVTIPSDVRHDLELQDGDRILLTVREGEIVLRPVGLSIFDLRGSIPVSGPQDLEAIRAEVSEQRARRRGRPDG